MKIVIIGTGEFSQIACEYFTHDSEHEVVAFAVDQAYLTSDRQAGLPVVAYETLKDHYPPHEYAVFVAIPASDLNRLRTRFYLDLKSKGYRFATYISSHAFVWRNAEIGENTFIFENNVIQPFVRIGNNCILWSGNHIGHRTVIHDHVFLASHVVISGYCEIGQGSFMGVNATLHDHVRVGDACVIGAAAMVSKDTLPGKIYVGNPAKPVPGKTSFESGI